MSNNFSYNSLGAPILRPGMATESDAIHTVGTFAPNPINTSVVFVANIVQLVTNSTYRIITVDQTGNTRVGGTFTSGATIDIPSFNNWFVGAIAPLFTMVSPGNLWNTAGQITVVANLSNNFYLNNNNNVTLTIERFTPGQATSNVLLANVAPQNNNGISSFSAGRLMVRDFAVENILSINPSLANFSSRVTRTPVKPLDLQHFQTFGFRGVLGIAAVNTQRQTPHRQPNDGYQIFDTVRIWRGGSVLARAANTANFNNSIVSALQVELAIPGQIGTLTNTNPSGTATAIPDWLLQTVSTRSYPGSVEVRLLGAR